MVIRQSENNKALTELIHSYQLQDNGITNSGEAKLDCCTTGTGARILADLDVRKLKVLGPQKKYIALSGFDLEVAEHVG